VFLGPIADQARKLQEQIPGSSVEPQSGGTYIVTVPNQPLPPGWSKPATTVYFQLPPSYPNARPDCFWTDADLRLASNALPQNSTMQQVAGLGEKLWFSYHPLTWDPSRDTLLTYVRVVKRRLNLTN
jgi:hypothetical protein